MSTIIFIKYITFLLFFCMHPFHLPISSVNIATNHPDFRPCLGDYVKIQYPPKAASACSLILPPLLQPPLGALTLELHHPPVESALLHQLPRRAHLCYPSIFQDDDLIGRLHRAHPVGDDQYGLSRQQSGQGPLNLGLVLHIEACSRLVQEHDGSVL